MKAMKIVNVINFPFPTPPDPVQLRVAETGLTALGALKYDKESKKHIITELGKSMSNFPVAPCFSKMLALSAQHNLMPYTITIVAALTVQEVLLETPVGNHVDVINKEQVANIRRIWAGRDNSFKLGDPMLLMKAVGAAEHDAAANGGSLSDFCDKYALRRKAMLEIRKLRQQLTNEVNLAVPGLGLVLDPMLSPPKDSEALLLRQIVLAGMVNQVARKIDVESEIKDPKEWPKWRCAYRAGSLRDPVFIHGKSVFTNKKSAKDLPEWIVYQEIFETDKMYLRGVTAIEPEWLPRFAMGLCNFLAPLQDPEPWYDEKSGTVMCKIKGTFGPQAWPLPVLELQYPDTADGARLKYLGKFFLEGKIFGSLSKVFESLLIRPGTLVKSTPFQSGPVKALLKALAGKGIDSKKKLVEAFESNDKFLLPEIKAVLPKSLHSEVEEIWPPSLE